MITKSSKLSDLDFITARREITYSMAEIKACLCDVGIDEPTEEDIVEFIHGWSWDDFGCPLGHELDRNSEIEYFDPRGNAINLTNNGKR